MTPTPLGLALKEFISQHTGRPCGLEELPEEATVENLPLYMVRSTATRTITSPLDYGDMRDANSMHDQSFFVDILAYLEEQRRDAEQALTDALAAAKDLPGVLGPPEIQRYGWTRQDKHLFRGIVIATYGTTAK